jgi:GcrA cell cycle regulator
MIETLRVMWPEGHFCSVIGKKLGVSGSAVAGKAHRLGLPHRPSIIKGEGPEIQRRREATKAASIVARRAADPVAKPSEAQRPLAKPSEGRRFEPVARPLPPPNTCRWPMGEPRTKSFRFCGEKCQTGMSYCAEHCQRAYARKT